MFEHDGLKSIDDRQNLGTITDLVALDSFRIAASVRHFMMLGDHLRCFLPAVDTCEQSGTQGGVRAKFLFLFGRHSSCFQPDCLGQEHHADIVHVDGGLKLLRINGLVSFLVGFEGQAQQARGSPLEQR